MEMPGCDLRGRDLQRIRISYTKNQLLRYTSTQDMQKLWERIFRRAQLPLAYSQGFHPQPKIQLACPLPLGMVSQAEFIDFWLAETFSLQTLQSKIHEVIHPGIEICDLQEIALADPSLQGKIESVTYRINLPHVDSLEEIEKKISYLLERDSIMRERRGKKYDLRPLLEHCEMIQLTSGEPSQRFAYIITKLSARPGATGRPEELLAELGIDPFSVLINRLEVTFTN